MSLSRSRLAAVLLGGLLAALLATFWMGKRVPESHLEQHSKEIHLLVQWFFSPIRARHVEFVEALKRNVLNPEISHIHFLQSGQGHEGRPWSLESFHSFKDDPGFPFELFQRKLVLSSHEFEDRLPMSVVFEYASKQLRKQLCIFANLDIFFDESLRLLKNPAIDLNYMNYYFLSRYEYQGDGEDLAKPGDQGEEGKAEGDGDEEDQDFMRMREVVTPDGVLGITHRGLGDQCGPNFIGSHDTIVFVPPLPNDLIGRCDVRVGSWGIENRLMWEFERFGIKVRNPCLDIKSWHIHKSLLKTGWTPLVNSENRSSVAHPQKLFPSPFVRLRVDLQQPVITPATIADGMAVMLRNEHSVRCLFSRSDAKYGHARCTEDYIDQHWTLKSPPNFPASPNPEWVSSLPAKVDQLSVPFIFQGRESQLCMVAKGTWVGHQACVPNHPDAFNEGLLWRIASLKTPAGAAAAVSPSKRPLDFLLVHEASGLCVFSAISDNLGMIECGRIGEEMVWKVDRLGQPRQG